MRSLGVTLAITIAAVCAAAWRAEAAEINVVQTNLVSDNPGTAALTDPFLVNPWGITESSQSPFWIANQSTDVATLYNVQAPVFSVSQNPLVVNIPTITTSPPQGPTGLVFNSAGTSSFRITGTPPGGTTPATASSLFIFANLDGSISGWNPAIGGSGVGAFSSATVAASTAGASYTGLAISQNLLQPVLYAANHAGTGSIDVFNSSFQPVSNTVFAGKFVDPNLPANLVPFNVQDLNGKVYVTYAPANQATATAGQGVVDTFDENGTFIARVATGGSLAAPWGVAIAPAGFGQFGGDLLVGNFATDSISVFDLTGDLLGTIAINGPGSGLLALQFGNGANGGNTDTLYFTEEFDGLFGAIDSPTATPLPATLPLFATGIGALGLLGWRRKRKAQAVA